jgi:ABC-type lipoprotein export system ATPase subunit
MMTPTDPLIRLTDVRKAYGGLRPLRINALSINVGDRVTLRGLDAMAAEMCVLLITGAALPETGAVTIAGRDTAAITTDTDWLSSLDLFGMVTRRAVLLDTLTVEANLALPLTLSIDPVPEEVRRVVAALADEVGLGRERLSAAVQSLSAVDRARVHLARALASSPQVLLIEHITASLSPEDAADLGRTVVSLADDRKVAWVALTEDAHFAGALGGTGLRLDPASGDVHPAGSQEWTTW